MSELHDLAKRLHHDLGKYATLQSRWLPPDASIEEREEAARADLLATARGPDGVRDAGVIAWAFLEDLGRLGVGDGVPVVVALRGLADAVETLRAADEGTAAAHAAVQGGVEAAAALRTASRAFLASTRPPEPDPL